MRSEKDETTGEWYLILDNGERITYEEHHKRQKAIQEGNYQFLQGRIKQLGYKSVADFRRGNPDLYVTSGTIANYFRGNSTMSPQTIVRLSYSLKMTPNNLLSILGYYDPAKQTIMDL